MRDSHKQKIFYLLLLTAFVCACVCVFRSYYTHLLWRHHCPAVGCSPSLLPSPRPDHQKFLPPAEPQSPAAQGSPGLTVERYLSAHHSNSGLTPPSLQKNVQRHRNIFSHWLKTLDPHNCRDSFYRWPWKYNEGLQRSSQVKYESTPPSAGYIIYFICTPTCLQLKQGPFFLRVQKDIMSPI